LQPSWASAMRSARTTLSDSGPKTAPNPNPKSGPAKESTSDPEPSGDPAPKPGSDASANGFARATSSDLGPKPGSGKSANASDGAAEKSNPAPFIVAADPTPVADPAILLKTFEAPAIQPRSSPEPATPVEVFVLPEPVAPSVSIAPQIIATPPTDSAEGDAPTPGEPGNLVFQLSLDSSGHAQKAQTDPAQPEETVPFLSSEALRSDSQTQNGASGSDAKSENQQNQQPPSLPQLPAAGGDGTIASQFGFETPLSFAWQTAAPKTESMAAPVAPRTPETVSTPDLPMAQSIDRVGLTMRGADDQVVRVEITQSGDLVQVGVHTGNNDLASELRASVPELVHRLDQQGYESRVSMPAASFASLAPAVIAGAHAEFRSGADAHGNPKSNADAGPQEELRQQRQKNPQRTWRELASQLQED